MDMFHYIAAIPAFFLGVLFIVIGLSGFRVDRTEAGKNCARIESWTDVLMGRVRPKVDWMPDSRVQCGMVYNRKEHQLEVSGRLSVESLKRGIRQP
jgi:hypothetical protein